MLFLLFEQRKNQIRKGGVKMACGGGCGVKKTTKKKRKK
jgi:hypothetical protein